VRLGFFSEIGIEALKIELPQAGDLGIPDIGSSPKADQVAADAQALDGARTLGQLFKHRADGPPSTLIAGLSRNGGGALSERQLLDLECG
jgi:hypothetical protein